MYHIYTLSPHFKPHNSKIHLVHKWFWYFISSCLDVHSYPTKILNHIVHEVVLIRNKIRISYKLNCSIPFHFPISWMLGKHWKYGNPQVYTFVILIDAQTFQALQSNQISLRIGNSKTQWKVEYFRCQIWGKVRPNQLSFQGHSQGIMQRQLIPSEKKKKVFFWTIFAVKGFL